MKQTFVSAISAVVLILATPTVSIAQDPVTDPSGVLLSENLSLLTTLPEPAVIGARFRNDVMYATTTSGLITYDISDPAAPVELGRLPLPHFENEDVDMGGNILLISNDASESTGILYVIDISDPAAPALLTAFPMGGAAGIGGPGHTASCVMQCKFAWVTNGGNIEVIDLRNPAVPISVGVYETPAGGGIATHDVQTDPSGLHWVVGFGGAAAYRLPADYAGKNLGTLVATTNEEGRSTYVEELGTGTGENPNDYILHNSMRRKNDDVVFITEEDYTRPACQGAGSLGSWKLPVDKKGRPTGADLTPLDQWETELLRDRTATSVQCSAHYFDLQSNVIVQGWYEQGMRVLDVSNPAKIRQIGFQVAPTSMNWAAYFAPSDPTKSIIYSFDFTHGIDVLKLTRPAKGPLSAPRTPCRSEKSCAAQRPEKVRAPVLDEWTANPPATGTANGYYGFACRLTGLSLPDLPVDLKPALPIPRIGRSIR